MEEITKLKSEAYDLIAALESTRKRLDATNQRILELLQKQQESKADEKS